MLDMGRSSQLKIWLKMEGKIGEEEEIMATFLENGKR
jgi:hypothetical protein